MCSLFCFVAVPFLRNYSIMAPLAAKVYPFYGSVLRVCFEGLGLPGVCSVSSAAAGAFVNFVSSFQNTQHVAGFFFTRCSHTLPFHEIRVVT